MKRSTDKQGSLAEWSKALALGASPKGRGFKSRSCHFCIMSSSKQSPAVLEISLQRPHPQPRRPAPDFLELFPDALLDPLPGSRSEAASPLPAEERKEPRSKAHFQEENEEDSWDSEPGELPISRKMKDLSGASRTQKRQITTVLMKAPPRSFSAFPTDEGILPLQVLPTVSPSPEAREIQSKPSSLPQTAAQSPKPEEQLPVTEPTSKTRTPLRLADLEVDFSSDLGLERSRVRTLTEEVGRLKGELQRIRMDNDRAMAELRIQKSTDLAAYLSRRSYEKQLSSKEAEIASLKLELELARKEANVHRQKHDSLSREVQSLLEQQRLLREEMAVREAEMQGERRGKAQVDKVEREEVDRLRVELDGVSEKAAKAEQDLVYWQRKAALARGEDVSAGAKLEDCIQEIGELRLQVQQFDAKNKELAAAYRAIQRDYSSVLDELAQAKGSRPHPALPPPLPTVQPDTSLLASLRSANVQVLAALLVKQEKLETDRQKLRTAMEGVKDTSNVQERGRKHALELELSLVESSLAMLGEKVARYRKQS